MRKRELVSVIIPAYNAAATIDETLKSVRNQTWKELEVLVVDDGSTDETRELVNAHAALDSRIRLIEKPNGGVASARNLGIAESAGDYIAPVDADDLWLPSKIEEQMAAMAAGGARVGLVYTWFAVINEDGLIIADDNSPVEEGDVLQRMCRGNLVGNGSSPLMRKSAVLEAGGYDAGLQAQRAQGCEDLKLYFEIARNYHFAVVRKQLTGYRWTPQNMSSNGNRMLRSYDLVMTPFQVIYGERYAADFIEGRRFIISWLYWRALKYGSIVDAARLWVQLAPLEKDLGLTALVHGPVSWLRHRVAPRPPKGPAFLPGATP